MTGVTPFRRFGHARGNKPPGESYVLQRVSNGSNPPSPLEKPPRSSGEFAANPGEVRANSREGSRTQTTANSGRLDHKGSRRGNRNLRSGVTGG